MNSDYSVEVSEDRFTTRMPLEEAAYLFNLTPMEVEDLTIGREIKIHRIAKLKRVESATLQVGENGRSCSSSSVKVIESAK